MPRCIIIFFFLFSAICTVQAQSKSQTSSGEAQKYKDVAGSPFFFNYWSDGIVRFSNGRIMKQFKLKFDCAHNSILLQFEGTSFAAEGKVQEFVIYPNNKKTDSVLFRKGFPPAENATTETFYQVLVDSKIKLLKLNIKNIIEQKQWTGDTNYRHYEDEERYYLLRDGTMLSVKKEKSAILALFSDKADILKSFIEQEQLKFRAEADLVRIVDKYNVLNAD